MPLMVAEDAAARACNLTACACNLTARARRRARAMRRGRSRIAHLRHDEYPEKFPDATVSDDVLGRLERAALLRLEALGTRRKRAPFV